MSEQDRLGFALDNLRATDWEEFELLASSYLSADFPDLQTVAGVGDRGRDAVLESVAKPGVILQYSIDQDWKSKIDATIARLKEAEVEFALLVYVTSRRLGPKAESYLLDLGVAGTNVVTRDRQYFVERVYHSAANTRAAERLSRRVIDPLLPGQRVTENSPIRDPELRAGLLYLELHLRDADTERNLSKLTHDSLVLAALRATDNENMMKREQLLEIVRHQMPERDPDKLQSAVEGSLERLRNDKRVVVRRADDSFALHHQERLRQTERAVSIIEERTAVRVQLEGRLLETAKTLGLEPHGVGMDSLLDALDEIFQGVLEQLGNAFAEGVSNGEASVRRRDVYPTASNVAVTNSRDLRAAGLTVGQVVELLVEVVTAAIAEPEGPIQNYLRELSDAYTLLAFTRSASDVQAAVGHFFSRGTLVLDATVLLPCFVETVQPPSERRFTSLLNAARECGMSLLVTDGVINEIAAHFNVCMHCLTMESGRWVGDDPFVLRHWRLVTDGGNFRDFVAQFRDDREDVTGFEQFLTDGLGITRTDLEELAERFPPETKIALIEAWRPLRRQRAQRSPVEEDMLLQHDVEMYLGVLGLRVEERADVFGYEAWWVTADGSAHRVGSVAREQGIRLPSRPCMSPGFLSRLLAFGPAKSKIGSDRLLQLPVALEIQRSGWGNPELAELAERIRAVNDGQPEWLVRRKVRRAMNKLKGTGREEQLTLDHLTQA
jgi:hypothetical protein